MTTTTNQVVKVGDVMILVKSRGDEPRTVNVDKVTATGQVVVRLSEKETVRFKPAWRGYDAVAPKYSGWDSAALYVYSEEKMVELKADCERVAGIRATEQASRDAHRREVEENKAAELAEVKAACGGTLFGRIRTQDTQPDGSRTYVVNLPVKAGNERKAGWEMMIVHCWESKQTWCDESLKVEWATTYCNGSSGSFSSVSTCRSVNDEDALWEAARMVYHSW